ncbi:MAG: ATP-binding protein, partial [Halobacteria archaeon]|nr:ATP-binding protein [Halobacteria archaeon]
MEKDIIGWALGPGETEDEFDFITPYGSEMKVGEFIYYTPEREGEENVKILCRIKARNRLVSNETDVTNTLETQIPGEEMAIFKSNRGYRITAKILGVYDESMGGFRNLHYADKELLTDILTPSAKQGILHLGHVLNRPEENVKVYTDMDEIATKHLSVLASTGAGKSYTVGVILEEMVKPGNRGTSVVFDIHGEYWTLAEDDEYSDKFNLIEEPRIKVSNLDI